MNKEEVIQFLSKIDEQDLLDILEGVFAQRKPYDPAEPSENRYFLGIADKDTGDEDPAYARYATGGWGISVCGYPDRKEYPREPMDGAFASLEHALSVSLM
jgi:hypothetical protein